MAVMPVPEIKPIQLTPEEATLRDQMEAEFAKGSAYTGEAAHKLTKLLQSRGAFPQARLDIFDKPFPGGRGKSHRDVFIQNGCSEDAIFQHPHFVAYLRYFINGPALPGKTIEEFRKILIDDLGTSGMLMDQLCKFARSETRRLGLSKDTARDEFWRLARELGYDHAETIRDAAASAGK